MGLWQVSVSEVKLRLAMVSVKFQMRAAMRYGDAMSTRSSGITTMVCGIDGEDVAEGSNDINGASNGNIEGASMVIIGGLLRRIRVGRLKIFVQVIIGSVARCVRYFIGYVIIVVVVGSRCGVSRQCRR